MFENRNSQGVEYMRSTITSRGQTVLRHPSGDTSIFLQPTVWNGLLRMTPFALFPYMKIPLPRFVGKGRVGSERLLAERKRDQENE